MRSERWYGMAMGGKWGCLIAMLMGLLIFASGAAAAQRSFASPEDAAEALAQAVKAHDRPATLAILGQDSAAWISSGDAAADQESIARFIAAYDARHEISREGNKATLTLGEDNFPFAFPIVQNGGHWRFDTAAGKEEMLARRIGKNELSTIEVLQAIVDAQVEYASEDRNGDGVLAYAQKIMSNPGKHDGLYWPAKAGEPESPLGELVAKAAGEGYRKSGTPSTAYHGYYYRLLSGQGQHAPSGALDYVVHGRAIGGFAVIAYPAKYGNSGIMTFMVNQDGKVYQADLGPNTRTRAKQIHKFDPGPEWSPVKARE